MSNTIPVNGQAMLVPEIMDLLEWGSYKANRKDGCTHEQLMRIGIGNESMKERYDEELRRLTEEA